mgnify:CR=1 FL=1
MLKKVSKYFVQNIIIVIPEQRVLHLRNPEKNAQQLLLLLQLIEQQRGGALADAVLLKDGDPREEALAEELADAHRGQVLGIKSL